MNRARRRLQADARKGRRAAWKIREPGAPSPVQSIRLLRGWWSEWKAWALRSILAGVDLDGPVDLALLRDRVNGLQFVDGPPPPTFKAWAHAGSQVATKAAEAQRAELRELGAPRAVLDRLDDPEVQIDARPPSFIGPRRQARIVGPRSTGINVLATPPTYTPPSWAITAAPVAVSITGPGGIVGSVLREWAAEGTALIRNVRADVAVKLPDLFSRQVEAGASWRTIQDSITGVIDGGAARMELIARDQVAKLNSRIAESFHRAAGIREYIWIASTDDRTRETHRAAHGTRVSWDSEGVPGTGFYGRPSHAGRGGQCRCSARAIPPADWLD